MDPIPFALVLLWSIILVGYVRVLVRSAWRLRARRRRPGFIVFSRWVCRQWAGASGPSIGVPGPAPIELAVRDSGTYRQDRNPDAEARTTRVTTVVRPTRTTTLLSEAVHGPPL